MTSVPLVDSFMSDFCRWVSTIPRSDENQIISHSTRMNRRAVRRNAPDEPLTPETLQAVLQKSQSDMFELTLTRLVYWMYSGFAAALRQPEHRRHFAPVEFVSAMRARGYSRRLRFFLVAEYCLETDRPQEKACPTIVYDPFDDVVCICNQQPGQPVKLSLHESLKSVTEAMDAIEEQLRLQHSVSLLELDVSRVLAGMHKVFPVVKPTLASTLTSPPLASIPVGPVVSFPARPVASLPARPVASLPARPVASLSADFHASPGSSVIPVHVFFIPMNQSPQTSFSQQMPLQTHPTGSQDRHKSAFRETKSPPPSPDPSPPRPMIFFRHRHRFEIVRPEPILLAPSPTAVRSSPSLAIPLAALCSPPLDTNVADTPSVVIE